MNPALQWTPERTATLTRLWGEDYSANQIAQELGITRNAVIGKVHRLKLSGRPSPIRAPKVRTPKPPIDYDLIRAMIKRGVPCKAAAQELGISQRITYRVRKEMVEAGEVSASNQRQVTTIAQRAIEKRARREEAQKAIEVIPTGERVPGASMAALEAVQAKPHGCRYPIGNPGERGFHFCGELARFDSAYCHTHHAITHLRPDQIYGSLKAAEYMPSARAAA